jgi:hypothetical protein
MKEIAGSHTAAYLRDRKRLSSAVAHIFELPGPHIHEGPSYHWISFELAGTKSNKLALNARVRVTSGDISQIDEVRSGGSYMSQNDLRLHFGLGEHRQADNVEIHWPSGASEVLTNLAADRFYCVEEGVGIVPCAKIRPSALGTAGN